METLIKIALGFLLLVSAAAATGNYNDVYVDIYAEAVGNCVTGDVNLAQMIDASSFVFGSENTVNQYTEYGILADDNYLTGAGRETNLIQRADFVGNASGCENYIDQDLYDLYAKDNCLTDSNLTQWAMQNAGAIGTNNNFEQYTDAYAYENSLTMSDMKQISNFDVCAVGDDNHIDQDLYLHTDYNYLINSNLTQWAMQNADAIGYSNYIDLTTGSYAYDNCLTTSDMKQISDFNVCAVGDDNHVDQDLYQEANDNCLTGSELWQQTAKIADILGCCNDIEQYENYQHARGNCLTGSMLNQVICENAQITGTENDVYQGYSDIMETYAYDNCLIDAGMLQSINSKAFVEGCNNYVDHEISLYTDENCLTGGMLSQISTVISNG